jgi:hypothetical protein
MHKHFLLWPLLALFAATCSNDFELTDNWKEVPVVYAILSPRDTAHYIRVEKAFVDPSRSALEIARIPDSLYYPDNALDVFLINSRNQRFRFTRVDGVREGIVRQEGIFATRPNWLYKYKPAGTAVLTPGETYRLLIERKDGKPNITSETTIPRDFAFRAPNPADIPPRISFLEDSIVTRIEWRTDINGLFFNTTLNIRYREENLNGTVLDRKTLTWVMARNSRRGNFEIGVGGQYRATAEATGKQFFEFLNKNIQPTTDRVRIFEDIDVIVEGGGREIEKLLETQSANAGLTGAEVISNYTNLSEGYGLFTGKNVARLTKVQVTPQTLLAMQRSALTRGLNFK